MDDVNALSSYWHSLSKDCPGKTWFYAALNRAPIYRALRIDPNDIGAAYAVVPFRLHRIDGKAVVLAAWPPPLALDDADHDWLGIEAVVAWNPVDNSVYVLGDAADQIVGPLNDGANTIFGDARAFFQAWARQRAAFIVQYHGARANRWHAKPKERDEVPGALLIGDLAKVRLNPSALPAHIETVGIDPKSLNRAILRAAHLPRVTAANQLRSAA